MNLGITFIDLRGITTSSPLKTFSHTQWNCAQAAERCLMNLLFMDKSSEYYYFSYLVSGVLLYQPSVIYEKCIAIQSGEYPGAGSALHAIVKGVLVQTDFGEGFVSHSNHTFYI